MFQYCEMDTDSAYIALAGNSIDDLVTPEHRKHYFKHRSEWLPAECCDEHKEEYVNTRLAGRTWTATEPCCIIVLVPPYKSTTKGLNKKGKTI